METSIPGHKPDEIFVDLQSTEDGPELAEENARTLYETWEKAELVEKILQLMSDAEENENTHRDYCSKLVHKIGELEDEIRSLQELLPVDIEVEVGGSDNKYTNDQIELPKLFNPEDVRPAFNKCAIELTSYRDGSMTTSLL